MDEKGWVGSKTHVNGLFKPVALGITVMPDSTSRTKKALAALILGRPLF